MRNILPYIEESSEAHTPGTSGAADSAKRSQDRTEASGTNDSTAGTQDRTEVSGTTDSGTSFQDRTEARQAGASRREESTGCHSSGDDALRFRADLAARTRSRISPSWPLTGWFGHRWVPTRPHHEAF